MIMKKHLNEDNNYSILRNPSPYRIGRAPGAEMNADEKLKQQYLMRRAEEVATFQEKLQVIGQMEKVKPMMADLFRDITMLRNFVEGEQKEPLATAEHVKTLKAMVDKFDEMNNILTTEIIPLCDELAVTEPYTKNEPTVSQLGSYPVIQVTI